MAWSTYFDQECPTCGRRLRIHVEYLGKRVKCVHCRAGFEAWDVEDGTMPPSDSGQRTLQRAEELLATSEGRRAFRPR